MVKNGRANERIKPSESVRCVDQALGAAALAGRLDWCRRLIDAGADTNAIELGMYTPLMSAVIGNSREVVQLMLDRHADPHIALGPQQMTALQYALSGNPRPEIVALLLIYGQPCDSCSAELNNYPAGLNWVLTKAVSQGDKETVRMIIEAGANPRVPSPDLLDQAVDEGKPGSVQAAPRKLG